MNLECFKCSGKYREEKVSKVFLDKYIKNNIKMLRCENCGHELLPLDEVESIYQGIRCREQANFIIRLFRRLVSRFKIATSGYTVL